MKEKFNEVDYRPLKGKMVEKGYTQSKLANAMQMSEQGLNQRLNNKVQWKTVEIIKACEVLEIPLAEAHVYFFSLKV